MAKKETLPGFRCATDPPRESWEAPPETVPMAPTELDAATKANIENARLAREAEEKAQAAIAAAEAARAAAQRYHGTVRQQTIATMAAVRGEPPRFRAGKGLHTWYFNDPRSLEAGCEMVEDPAVRACLKALAARNSGKPRVCLTEAEAQALEGAAHEACIEQGEG